MLIESNYNTIRLTVLLDGFGHELDDVFLCGETADRSRLRSLTLLQVQRSSLKATYQNVGTSTIVRSDSGSFPQRTMRATGDDRRRAEMAGHGDGKDWSNDNQYRRETMREGMVMLEYHCHAERKKIWPILTAHHGLVA